MPAHLLSKGPAAFSPAGRPRFQGRNTSSGSRTRSSQASASGDWPTGRILPQQPSGVSTKRRGGRTSLNRARGQQGPAVGFETRWEHSSRQAHPTSPFNGIRACFSQLIGGGIYTSFGYPEDRGISVAIPATLQWRRPGNRATSRRFREVTQMGIHNNINIGHRED